MDHGSPRRQVFVQSIIVLGLLVAAGARANTITVNAIDTDIIANDGKCTFREAIIAANTNTASGPAAGECAAGDHFVIDTIAFNIPVPFVHPAFPLDHITESVLIDGFTQPGSSPNSNPFPGPLNAVIKVEIELTSAGGLYIDGPGVTIRGLAINSGGGIVVNADDAVIVGCYIGTHGDGSSLSGAPTGYGILVNGTRHRTKIGYSGGSLTADRNLITYYANAGIQSTGAAAGNGSPDMNIIGNFIGTDASGTASLQVFAGFPAVGMTVANAVVNSNLISGNGGGGIDVVAPGNSVIQGLCGTANSANLIGVQRDGVTPLPNGGFGGVIFHGGNSTLGGGPCTGEGNVIAYNTGTGVRVEPGVAGVRITQNSIHHNTSGGISLTGTTTPLANDPCDADTAPGNHGQNYPVLTSVNVSSGLATAIGTIEGKANTSYGIELFSSAVCSGSGHGEGQAYIGSTSVTTDATCTTNFVIFSSAVPSGHTVFTVLASDTSTDPAHWDTSEFSACFPPSLPGASFYTITPCRVVDTRNPAGPYGGPALAANVDRTFVIQGQCGVPVGAKAAAFNLAVTLSTAAGDLRMFPGGSALPLVSAINWNAGKTRADNAVIRLGPSGDITVHPDMPSGSVHLILDVFGYFQ